MCLVSNRFGDFSDSILRETSAKRITFAVSGLLCVNCTESDSIISLAGDLIDAVTIVFVFGEVDMDGLKGRTSLIAAFLGESGISSQSERFSVPVVVIDNLFSCSPSIVKSDCS